MKSFFLIPLILLNALPIYGVLEWGWKSFDLIFLYWLENVIIGAFTVLRMLVRPYSHILMLIPSLFLAGFFTIHYGAFTGGHGIFVFSLFGDNDVMLSGGFSGAYHNILPTLQQNHLMYAAFGLLLLHAFDWLRDTAERGLGSDSLHQLMTAPYRRIVVLHVAIIGSGFALALLGEPIAGLLLLVVIKTISDIYHWRQDEKKVEKSGRYEELSPEERFATMAEKFPEPKFVYGSGEVSFDSFTEMKESKQYKNMLKISGLFQADKVRDLKAYVDYKVEQETNIQKDNL